VRQRSGFFLQRSFKSGHNVTLPCDNLLLLQIQLNTVSLDESIYIFAAGKSLQVNYREFHTKMQLERHRTASCVIFFHF